MENQWSVISGQWPVSGAAFDISIPTVSNLMKGHATIRLYWQPATSHGQLILNAQTN
jgi:hypothetical protein